jgi:hypothetical protein
VLAAGREKRKELVPPWVQNSAPSAADVSGRKNSAARPLAPSWPSISSIKKTRSSRKKGLLERVSRQMSG